MYEISNFSSKQGCLFLLPFMKNLLELTQHCTLIASRLMLCSLKICQELKTIPHQLSTHVPYILSYSLSFTFDHQPVIQTSLPVYQGLIKYLLPPPTSAFHPSPLFTILVICTCTIHPYIPMQLVLNDCLILKIKVMVYSMEWLPFFI